MTKLTEIIKRMAGPAKVLFTNKIYRLMTHEAAPSSRAGLVYIKTKKIQNIENI